MTPEEMLNKLDSSRQDMMKEQYIIKQFEEALVKKTKDLISEHYSEEVHHLSADGYRALDSVIFNHVSRLAVDLTFVLDDHQEE